MQGRRELFPALVCREIWCTCDYIVWLVRILGSHPSDAGSSPGGGILFGLRRSGEHVFPPLLSSVLRAEVSAAMEKSFCCRFGRQGK